MSRRAKGLQLADTAFLGRAGNQTFSPPDPTNLVLWLKPETLAALGLNNGDPIDTWADSSGNGNDMSAENSSFRPLYRPSGINSVPAADFDGADDFLSRPTNFGVTDHFTLFVVLKFDAAVPATGREWIFKNGEGTGWGVAKWDGNRNGFYLNGTFLNDASCTISAELWTFRRTAAPLATLRVNSAGVAITNDTAAMGSNPDNNSRLGIFLNGTFPLDGRIAEVALYKTNISDGDRGLWETYLTGKFTL